MWCDAFENPGMITAQFQDVPEVARLSVWDLQIFPDSQPYLTMGTHLATLPDQPNLREGQIPEKTEIGMAFIGLQSLTMTGMPTNQSGELTVRKQEDAVSFSYLSSDFQLGGVCQRAVITYLGVVTRFDGQRHGPRGPNLFSHPNVWDTCLLLMRDYGYTISVSGHSAYRGYLSRYRWTATMSNGTKLSADNPIELCGLVALHRHHGATTDAPYWWRIDGPPLMADLLDACDKASDPRKSY